VITCCTRGGVALWLSPLRVRGVPAAPRSAGGVLSMSGVDPVRAPTPRLPAPGSPHAPKQTHAPSTRRRGLDRANRLRAESRIRRTLPVATSVSGNDPKSRRRSEHPARILEPPSRMFCTSKGTICEAACYQEMPGHQPNRRVRSGLTVYDAAVAVSFRPPGQDQPWLLPVRTK
jgi:hypothetical protein